MKNEAWSIRVLAHGDAPSPGGTQLQSLLQKRIKWRF